MEKGRGVETRYDLDSYRGVKKDTIRSLSWHWFHSFNICFQTAASEGHLVDDFPVLASAIKQAASEGHSVYDDFTVLTSAIKQLRVKVV